jgi:hypothetical protein
VFSLKSISLSVFLLLFFVPSEYVPSEFLSSVCVPGICVQSVYAERKDPTRPATYVASGLGELNGAVPVLNTILIGPGRRLAVVDGHIFKEGDRHKGLLVAKIKSDRVLVSINNKTIMLRLNASRNATRNAKEEQR